MQPVHAQQITDMLGRTVTLPAPPLRVLTAAPPLSALMMTLAPEQLIALNRPIAKTARPYIPTELSALPVIGSTMDHGAQMDPETVLRLQPDLILAWGGGTPSDSTTALTQQFFSRLHIPVVFVRLDTLDDWPAAFKLVGRVLGKKQRATQLADWIRHADAQRQQRLAGLTEPQQVRVYYAEGIDGLATECHRSFHVEAITLAGGYNVHRCRQHSMMGMEKISMEQLLAYAPDVIVVQNPALIARSQQPAWQRLKAIQQRRWLVVPQDPLNWLDRPPSFTRAIGSLWLAHHFYPQHFTEALAPTVRSFYRTFWHTELSDAQLTRLLTPTHPALLQRH